MNTISTPDIPTFKLVALGCERVDEIIALENVSMRTGTTFPLTKDELVELFNDGYIAYGFEDSNGVLIAKVGFTRCHDGSAELDVCVHPNSQGKGIGQKVMELSTRKYLDENRGMRIFLSVHPENPARRLYEKLGFRENGGIQVTTHGPRIIMNYEGNY